MPSSYALGKRFEDMMTQLIEEGRYNSKSEVIREGLRLVEEREQQRSAVVEEIRSAIREGMESGPGISADDVRSELVGKYKGMLETSSDA